MSGTQTWQDDLLADLNAQCLGLLREQAGPMASLPVLRDLASEWQQLDDRGHRQLAASPYLLVDAGFVDEARWRRLHYTGVQDLPRAMRSVCFPAAQVADITRQVLFYAWHLCRAEPLAARMVLGVTEGCRQRIAALALREIELLCARHPWWVRPRWELQPEVWRALLRAAGGKDGAALHGTVCRGVQLMAASLLQPDAARRPPVAAPARRFP
ncbi:MAG: hypothetical protein RL026_1055 [Pseudomonadota bacterium]|jgi:hypothetical protein